jgi:multidrug resistance efflux pump
LRDATIVAPFGGTVGAVNVRVGEMVSPGQPLVTLGDLDTLRVETTDLDEIDVVRVSVDQEVAVTFDAFPDRVFKGRVTRISPMAESGSGGVHYTVVVELDEMDPALRWGMTAFVDIETR